MSDVYVSVIGLIYLWNVLLLFSFVEKLSKSVVSSCKMYRIKKQEEPD